MKKILLIVDPQIDFITGSLPVAGAAESMDKLADFVAGHSDDYLVRLVTSDWHPYNHCSFDRKGGPWPAHCVQHSEGAALWPSLLQALNETKGGFTMLYKGQRVDREEYSIMQAEDSAQVIRQLMKALQVELIDVCGVAGDVCVLNTAKDLIDEFGPSKINVLEHYSPSLDGGQKLREFVKNINRKG